MNANELRQKFFEFFRSREHEIVASASMVVKNDPTLMFTNAGMNQFKDIFLGNQAPGITRVANSQKCLRVSGKHNDLEEVGHDTYHHTMFEMLGNWSFGDYFKKEAIEWAWDFLTKELQIPENRLYTTIFEGNEGEKVPKDSESLGYWKQCFRNPEGRILEFPKKDNFWEMGETGPCGPCSEIHVDLRDDAERKKVPGNQLVNKGNPLVIEIWNLVFIQYNRKADGTLELLPSRHVDTGMGFERLCMVVQGKKSNYDTDIFQSTISEISSITGKEYGKNEKWDIAMRVIADHLRAVSFSVADGLLPSNNKAGYVIRRILRRAVRYGCNNLEIQTPFIYRLVPALVRNMGGNFPELKVAEDHISRVIHEEETAFLKTLDKGNRILDRRIEELKKEKKDVLEGSIAFELYDTYGFPVDLTQLILRENEMKLDLDGFEQAMKGQKDRSREDASVEAGDWKVIREREKTVFTGYDSTEDNVMISRYRKVKVKGREVVQLVFDRTPFYAESGGQVGDMGLITDGAETIVITDTLKENNLIIHIAEKLPADPKVMFRAVVDKEKRDLTENNHSATHLLHYALRKVLGDSVEQKGSLVTPERLRFDFSHFTKLSKEEISGVESIVNSLIRKNIKRNVSDEVPFAEAKKMGAMALFGEKYGDRVRVVGFGDSVELCGGTHVASTGSIGMLKIISESAVASGIRRIEAVTASGAEEYLNNIINSAEEIAALLNLKSTSGIVENVGKLVNENSALRKTVEKYRSQSATWIRKNFEQNIVQLNGFRLIRGIAEADSTEILKAIASQLRGTSDDLVLVTGASVEGRASLLVMVCDRLVSDKKINAVTLLKSIAGKIEGSGGGQPFLAIAGGKNPGGLQEALDEAEAILRKF
ncbi:MAG TPA: alanine--tRNA ligase [Bacteroidales bacterium]|nr:alanine--tRNA ligase [Bacteroidales bacterium]